MRGVPMESHNARFPSDMWRAFELTAEREEIPVAEVLRIGGLSYSAFSMARAGVEPTMVTDEPSRLMWELFEAARRAVEAWQL
jgi:hypothetical protein